MAVLLKSREDLDAMRVAGRVVHQTLQHCREICRPGTTTGEIDEAAYRLFTDLGGRGLFKNYPTYRPGEGFPGNLCISVNETVVHGIPGDRVVQEGDLVGIDCGVQVDGWCGDSATTIMVGQVSDEDRRLCEVTQRVLEIAIENIRPGRKWSQVARMMQNYAEEADFSVVRDFVGHGIGRKMHEEPKIPNFVSPDLLRHDITLREGMVMAIEPMCNAGGADVVTLADGWTVKTRDGKAAAHYEHTVAVVADGAEVLTDGN